MYWKCIFALIVVAAASAHASPGSQQEQPSELDALPAACRTWGVHSENEPQNEPQQEPFLPDSPPHSPAMGQEGDENCTAAAVHLQHTTSKSDGLLGIGQSSLSMLEDMRSQAKDHATVLLDNALSLIGVPYRRGGSSAKTGFDCSGFVRAVYAQSWGQMLPRSAREQATATDKIDKADLKPGDLVFFNTMRRAFSHVGIYMGEGKFIHSPRTGKSVRIESMDVSYWKRRFDGARRVEISDQARDQLLQQTGFDGVKTQDLIRRAAEKTGIHIQ